MITPYQPQEYVSSILVIVPPPRRACGSRQEPSWKSGGSLAFPPQRSKNVQRAASFVNRSTLLMSWEKTETCAVSASGVYGPKNAAIMGMPVPYAATESHHVADRTALV